MPKIIKQTRKIIFTFISVSLMFSVLLVGSNAYAASILKNRIVLDARLQNRYEKYEFVLFYNNSCNYCPDFCKTLKAYAAKHWIPVTAFKLTRESSSYFPNSIMVDQNTINQYFGEGAKIAVPVLFLLNPAKMHVYPVSRGNLTYTKLTLRINDLMRNIRQFEMREHEEK